MMFQDAIRNLTDGYAAKPTTWRGYVQRIDDPPEWTSSASYAVDSVVKRNGTVYRCTSATSGSTYAPPSAKWTALWKLPTVFSTLSTYAVGDVVTKDSYVYLCISTVSPAGAWNDAKWARIPDVPHALMFREGSDANPDGDNYTKYLTVVTYGADGAVSYGEFSHAFKMDPLLFRSIVNDESWATDLVSVLETARGGTGRW